MRPTLPEAVRIRKNTLHDQVVTCVRDLIIEGHLAQGERIEEVSLARDLGVSRTPLREALRTLAAEGLGDIEASRGATVRKLAREEVRSILEVLAELERLAGRLTTARASDEELDELVAVHDAMMGYYVERARLPYFKLNQEFHSRVAALFGNTALAEVQTLLQARLKRIRFIGNRHEQKWSAAVADHERMVERIRARDGEGFGEAMAAHMMATWERVEDVV